MVCYWPTVLMCLPDCNHEKISAVLPGIRDILGVSAWPAPYQAAGRHVFIDITHWQAPLGGAFAAAWALLDMLKQKQPRDAWRAGIAPGMASARFAATAAEPGNLIDIPAWSMAEVLAYVPLSAYMGVMSPRLQKRLSKDGIRTFDDVLQFSASEWIRCYGDTAASIRRACLGLDYLDPADQHINNTSWAKSRDEYLKEHQWRQLSHSIILPANASSHRALRSYLRVMCVRLSRELRQRSQRTGRVELELWSAGPRPVWAFGVGLGSPGNEANKIFTVLQAGLKQLAEYGPVARMSINASQLSHEAGQLDLLDHILPGQNTQKRTMPSINR